MGNDDYTSIRVKQSTKEQAQKAKRPKETWDDFILRCSEEPAITLTEDDIDGMIRDRVSEMVVEEALR